MRRFLALTVLTALTAVPFAADAQAADPYADEVLAAGNQVFQPMNILGAPDGAFTDFFSEGQAVLLDMGATEEGTGDLLLHYRLLQFGASYVVEFLDKDQVLLASKGAILPVGQTIETVAYEGNGPYRLLRIRSTDEEILRLDAVEATAIVAQAPAPPGTPPEEDEEPPLEEPASAPRGILVKLLDDGDPDTTVDAAVYVIGENGTRHAFPSEAVFRSWYRDFSDIAFIDPMNLASYPLKKNVTARPGTHLVKITTDPRVYAVEPGGVLRWITTEAIAKTLYGQHWAKRVVDVPDVFIGNYVKGADIDAAVHPNGTLGVMPSGEVVYLRNGVSYSLPGGVFEAMRFQSDFFVTIAPAQAALYVSGGTLALDPDIRFPY